MVVEYLFFIFKLYVVDVNKFLYDLFMWILIEIVIVIGNVNNINFEYLLKLISIYIEVEVSVWFCAFVT